MNKSFYNACLLLTLVFGLYGCSVTVQEESSPKLQIIMVVDGLRADLLDHYDEVFTGGFRKLKDEGALFTNAFQDHGMTVTAAGHTSISTGTYPQKHGIVSNQWFSKDADGWKQEYAVEDADYQIVGFPDETGMSPDNIQVTGLADWLTEAYPGSRVVSVSGKDRAAITMASKARGHIYWFDDDFAGFSTSTYYRDENPDWVKTFNQQVFADYFQDSWECTVPEAYRKLARPDSASFESDGKFIAFPYKMNTILAGRNLDDPELKAGWMEDQPIIDQLVFGFAKSAIRELQLGQNQVPDFLALGLSATDRVSHRFGPRSLENLDNLMQLDRELGLFLDFLDQEVGKDNYVIALSADHGFNDAPEYRVSQGLPGRRVFETEIEQMIGEIGQLDFESNYDQALEETRTILMNSGIVERVFTETELAANPENDELHELWQRSYFPGRLASELAQVGIAGIEVKEGMETRDFGSSHGTHYFYDRHVPVIFYGQGVKPGIHHQKVRTVDIAPTIATLFQIPFPDNLDGRPLDIR